MTKKQQALLCLIILVIFQGCIQIFDQSNPFNPSKQDDQKDANIVLVLKMKTADTILIVSHTGINYDSVAQKMNQPELIVNQRINRNIIHEQKVITGNDLDSLCKILSLPVADTDIVYHMCFIPHHTIFLVSKKQLSYLDLCFSCFGLNTFDDLKEIEGYDPEKWHALLTFFRSRGFKYEMPN